MRKVLLFSICSIVLLSTGAEALRFGAAPRVEIPTKTLVQFLPARNEALEKALEVHNLMTELPSLRAMAEQQTKLKSEMKRMEKYFDNLLKCNEKRLGKFKNAKDVLKKVRQAYADRTKKLESDIPYDENSIVPRSLADGEALSAQKKEIEQELMVDVLTNGKKWGGQSVSKKQEEVPEDMETKMERTGLEELAIAEDGTYNAKQADADFDRVFLEMQQDFIKKLSTVGVNFPDFNAARGGDIRKVQKELSELKKKHLEDAKAYIVKLDEQDAAHPRAAARRAARSQNKKKVLSQVRAEFPEAFEAVDALDQQTPQQRQMTLVLAMEKDENGTVYLTETNALEVDQRMAEAKSNEAMLKNFQDQANAMIEDMKSQYPNMEEFDFSVCST